ncbi:MAG: hypothetical protein IJX76_01225 [Clostridia bacterium]|nr:hypothetical protein [Clostridia bacterium]
MKRVLFCLLMVCMILPSCQSETTSDEIAYDHVCRIIKYKWSENSQAKAYLTYNEWNKELDCSGTWYPNCTYSRAYKTLGALSPITISNFTWQTFDVEVSNIEILEGRIDTNRSSCFTFIEEDSQGNLIYQNSMGDRIEFSHSGVTGCHICATYYINDSVLAMVDIFPY